MSNLGAPDLQAFLQARGIPGEILHLEVPTPTVESAAVAVGAAPEQIIKSILFLVDGRPVLAVACGTSAIDQKAIAQYFGVGRKRVKLAPPEQVLETSGYEVGAMPPFGHRQPLSTLIDVQVLELSQAYAGGGAENALLHLNPRNIQLATGAVILKLHE